MRHGRVELAVAERRLPSDSQSAESRGGARRALRHSRELWGEAGALEGIRAGGRWGPMARRDTLCGLRPRLPRGRPRHGRADGRLVRRAAARQAHTHICLAGSSTDTSAIVYGLLTGKHSLGKHAPSAEARDAAKAAKLWELSEGLLA